MRGWSFVGVDGNGIERGCKRVLDGSERGSNPVMSLSSRGRRRSCMASCMVDGQRGERVRG
jgi:hypothetical protein